LLVARVDYDGRSGDISTRCIPQSLRWTQKWAINRIGENDAPTLSDEDFHFRHVRKDREVLNVATPSRPPGPVASQIARLLALAPGRKLIHDGEFGTTPTWPGWGT